MKLHAVVVNWNGGEQNLTCLASLRAAGLQPREIHFVDNGSDDGSVTECELRHPGLSVQHTGTNLGFAAAANRGLRAALAAGAEAVLLMNNDATADSGALTALVDAAEARPQCGLYGPRIYSSRSTDTLWCCGVTLGGPNLGALRGYQQRGAGRYLRDEEVDSLTGCGLLITRSVIERIGYLDEAYFVYVEDADYCARARAAGFAPLYVANAIMEHAGAGSTGGGYGATRKYLNAHGTVLYLRRHGSAGQWLWWLGCDLLLWPVVFFVAACRGRAGGAWGKLRGTVDALCGRAARRPRSHAP